MNRTDDPFRPHASQRALPMRHGTARPWPLAARFTELERAQRLLVTALRLSRRDDANGTAPEDGEARALLEAAGLDPAAVERVAGVVALLRRCGQARLVLACPGCQGLTGPESALAGGIRALEEGRVRDSLRLLDPFLPARLSAPSLAMLSLAIADLAAARA